MQFIDSHWSQVSSASSVKIEGDRGRLSGTMHVVFPEVGFPYMIVVLVCDEVMSHEVKKVQ